MSFLFYILHSCIIDVIIVGNIYLLLIGRWQCSRSKLVKGLCMTKHSEISTNFKYKCKHKIKIKRGKNNNDKFKIHLRPRQRCKSLYHDSSMRESANVAPFIIIKKTND